MILLPFIIAADDDAADAEDIILFITEAIIEFSNEFIPNKRAEALFG